MNRKDDEGVIITVHRSDAQHGVVHAEPCDCHEHIQIGAQENDLLEVIDQFLGDIAARHNAIVVGCSECGWEGFIGPGDKAASDGDKAVVSESDCPECGGDLIDLRKDTCEEDNPALDPFYDEEELTNHDL